MPAAVGLKTKPPRKTSPRGHLVRVMTAEERAEDIKAFGREVRQSKASAIAFLKSAGILDNKGDLAEPFRG